MDGPLISTFFQCYSIVRLNVMITDNLFWARYSKTFLFGQNKLSVIIKFYFIIKHCQKRVEIDASITFFSALKKSLPQTKKMVAYIVESENRGVLGRDIIFHASKEHPTELEVSMTMVSKFEGAQLIYCMRAITTWSWLQTAFEY